MSDSRSSESHLFHWAVTSCWHRLSPGRLWQVTSKTRVYVVSRQYGGEG